MIFGLLICFRGVKGEVNFNSGIKSGDKLKLIEDVNHKHAKAIVDVEEKNDSQKYDENVDFNQLTKYSFFIPYILNILCTQSGI